MPYTKQTWVDGSGGGTPISATRLDYIETGIDTAHDTADGSYKPGGTDVAIVDGGTGVSTLPSGLLKGAGTGAITAAAVNTDYALPLTTTAKKTANYTAAANEIIPVDSSGGVVTITILTAPANGTRVIVKKVDASTNAVTVGLGGSDVFNLTGGTTTRSLVAQGDAIQIQYASGIWVITSAISSTSGAYLPGGTDVALADGGTGTSLVDPNADRLLFWDDSAGAMAFLTPGSGLTVTGTTMTAAGGGGGGGSTFADLGNLTATRTLAANEYADGVTSFGILTANTVITLPTPTPGAFTLALKQNATGGFIPTFSGGSVDYPAGAISWLTGPNALNVLEFRAWDTVAWHIFPATSGVNADESILLPGMHYDVMDAAVTNLPRFATNSTQIATAGTLWLSYFRSNKSFTVNNLSVLVSSPAMAGATLCRMGIFSIETNGDLTLAASTPSDTTLCATTFATSTKATSAPYDLVFGNRYAFGFLMTGTTPPTLQSSVSTATETALGPRLSGVWGSRTDLPSSVTVANQAATGKPIFFRAS